MYKTHPALSAEHPAEGLLLRALSGVLISCIVLYLYFVSASVLNVITRSEAQLAASSLEGSIGVLQQEYFDLSQDVSRGHAVQLGLAPVAHVSYVHLPGDVGMVDTHKLSDNAN